MAIIINNNYASPIDNHDGGVVNITIGDTLEVKTEVTAEMPEEQHSVEAVASEMPGGHYSAEADSNRGTPQVCPEEETPTYTTVSGGHYSAEADSSRGTPQVCPACPTGAEAHQNELIRKYDLFVATVKGENGGMNYGFFELEKVAALSKVQRGRLISKIVERADKTGAYAIAMLCFLGYHEQMQAKFLSVTEKNITQKDIAKHWMKALGLRGERNFLANFRICTKPECGEDRLDYKAGDFELVVKEDYEAILNS